MTKQRKQKLIFQAVLVIAAILLVAYELKQHAPAVMEILRSGNTEDLEAYVRSQGSRGVLALVLLQIIETVAIVIPSLPVYICAGIIFGTIKGTAICYLTNLILNILMFLAGKHLLGSALYGSEKESPVQALLQKTTHPIRALFILCLLPIMPGGMIPLLSSQTKLTLKEFLKGMSAGSLLAITVYVACGSFLMAQGSSAFFIVVTVCILIFGLVMVFRKKIIAALSDK